MLKFLKNDIEVVILGMFFRVLEFLIFKNILWLN